MPIRGRQGGRLEELDQEAVTLQTGQGQDPGGDGGTHIGTHNHTYGLSQLHNAGVYQTNQHNGHCRGRLNGNGNAGT